MAEFPALPLWTDAYLGDTMHLSLEQHGAYLKLLIIAWRASDCALPNDDAKLARMLGVTPKKWASIKPHIAPFFTISAAIWTQKKLTETRRAVAISSSKQSSRAKARWNDKPLKNNNVRDAVAMPQGMPDRCRNDAIQNHNHKEDTSVSSTPIVPKQSDPFDAFWKAYPRRVGKEAARKAFSACRKRGAEAWHIIEGAEWLASHPPDDPQFIPHPATWLNQGRYDDERLEHGKQPVAGNRSAPAGGYRRSIGLDMLRAAADEAGFDWGGTPEPDRSA